MLHQRHRREKQPVAYRQRHVALDLPVHEYIRLKAQESVICSRLVDRRLAAPLAEEKDVHTGLKLAKWVVIDQRERRSTKAHDEDVRQRWRERQAVVDLPECVERVVVGVARVAAERVGGVSAIGVTTGR